MNVRHIVIAALAVGFAGMSARAHHSIEEQYDSARFVELAGTITKVELVNPQKDSLTRGDFSPAPGVSW